MAKEILKAETESLGGFKVSCKARDCEFIIDEPVKSGGTNAGMNPLETLLNALGACMTIMAQSFASTKKINLKSFKVELEGKIDTDRLNKKANVKVGFSKITANIHIKADNTTAEIQDFVDFIEKTCPVRDTIENAPKFETKIVTN
ncbi:MAG TPA: OsmC family protein [Tetragenococcus sp.]|nr:OsmC family protein [Tetragenococcus sp.]